MLQFLRDTLVGAPIPSDPKKRGEYYYNEGRAYEAGEKGSNGVEWNTYYACIEYIQAAECGHVGGMMRAAQLSYDQVRASHTTENVPSTGYRYGDTAYKWFREAALREYPHAATNAIDVLASGYYKNPTATDLAEMVELAKKNGDPWEEKAHITPHTLKRVRDAQAKNVSLITLFKSLFQYRPKSD